MPIYEPDLSYEDMKKAQDTFKCAECGGILILAWSASHNCYMLRCGNNLEHKGVVPLGRDPELLEIANKLKGRPLQMETNELKKLDPRAMVERVNQARFPKDLTIADRQLIAKISIEYGLDPLFNELMIYQGRPYITIDSRRRKAQETGLLDGISARPATKKEKEARRVPDEDYCFIAEVWVKGASHPFEGVGRVRKAETEGDPHLPIVKDPAAQCEKRAEAQALRRAFHLPLPSFEEIVEGEFEVVASGKEATKSKSSPPKAGKDTTAPPVKGKITEPQRKKIWRDAEAMGYKENEVHNIVEQKWGVKSLNELTVVQASTLIDMIAKGEGIPAPGSKTLQEEPEHLVEKGEEE